MADESGREGMRIVVEIDVTLVPMSCSTIFINTLPFKLLFGFNMLAIDKGRSKDYEPRNLDI